MIETALISTVFGALTKMAGKWMQDRTEQKTVLLDFKISQLEAKESALQRAHEFRLAKMASGDAAKIADINAGIRLREFDSASLVAAIESETQAGGGRYIEALRASVRPLLVFMLTIYVFTLDLQNPVDVLEVWGMAVGFYFGARIRV